jgi:hypothetical protein
MKSTKGLSRQRERLLKRWSEEDYPGGTPRFQLNLLAKDLVVFCLIPITAVVLFKIVEASMSGPRKQTERRQFEPSAQSNEKQSQIIHFHAGSSGGSRGMGFAKRAPGTLVRVKLLNVVETFSNAPVHAQVIDAGLGREFLGGTLLGDAVPETGSGRINIVFRFVRHPKRPDLAVPLSARAMSLDGTFGLDAQKKEGFFARAAIRSATGGGKADIGGDPQDFKSLVARAVAQGMMQEFDSEATVANNRAQVLTLTPMTEFFVELTDYFPSQAQ